MIQLHKFKKVDFIYNNKTLKNSVKRPFNKRILDFIDNLSKELFKNKETRDYDDLITFAYWCRRSNIEQLSLKYSNINNSIGRGVVLHITPSNVPITCLYSFIFGLITGNNNVVKIPSKKYSQIIIFFKILNKILLDQNYSFIKLGNIFFRCERNNEIINYLSLYANSRIIWGGDNTIETFKKIETNPRCIDVNFSDRYSISVINTKSLKDDFNKNKKIIIKKFFNDTYLFDQNGCSTPHLILWYGKKDTNIKKKFWDELYRYVKKKFEIDKFIAYEKFVLQNKFLSKNYVSNYKKYENYLHIIKINKFPKNVEDLRGKFGFFFEKDIKTLNEIVSIVNPKFQTLTYFGLDKYKLLNFVIDKNLIGIDRIVPFGSAFNIGLIWDGYDLYHSLSRKINYE